MNPGSRSPTILRGDALALRPFDESLPMSLLRAREATMRLFRPLLGRHDLTEQQWRVLRALIAGDGPLEIGELVDQTSLLAPSVTRIVSNLDARNLVRRTTARHDQRRAHVALTDAGLTLVRAISPESEAAYELIERSFGKARLQRLLVELDELTALGPTFDRYADDVLDGDERTAS